MPAKFGIFFLGVTVGGAAFLTAGLAFFLTITQLQSSTMQARATQAAVEANQVSTRAKNAPVMVDAERYKLVFKTP
jgi:hypothetical protein